MNAWRGIATRIVVLGGVSAFVAAWAPWILVSQTITTRTFVWAGDQFADFTARAHAGCGASPATWSDGGEHWDAWAYDRESLASANPAAPEIDAFLRARRALGLDPGRLYATGRWGGATLLDLGGSGPCSALLVRFEPPDPDRGLRWNLLGALGLGVLVSFLLATLLAIRPLLKRVERLGAAAAAVGTPRYRSETDPGDGPLAAVATALDDADRRVRAEAEAEVAQRRALEEHLANVAHDLRTPLAVLLLRLEEAADAPADEVADVLGPAFADVGYLALLTENLLLAARLQSGATPDAPPADLAEIARRVTGRAELLGRRRGVRVEAAVPDGELLVAGPTVYVEQALANLVHNATAHASSEVAVLVEPTERGFRILVVDDGPGVPPDVMPRLGERTFRTDAARQRDPAGAGLGLAIVRELSERAGWTLRFAAAEGGGLQVELTGPREGATPARRP